MRKTSRTATGSKPGKGGISVDGRFRRDVEIFRRDGRRFLRRQVIDHHRHGESEARGVWRANLSGGQRRHLGRTVLAIQHSEAHRAASRLDNSSGEHWPRRLKPGNNSVECLSGNTDAVRKILNTFFNVTQISFQRVHGANRSSFSF